MKGRIKLVSNDHKYGFIVGDDGVQYFYHWSGLLGKYKPKADNIVEFDIGDAPKDGSPVAINIHKIGHGRHHPLAVSMQRIGEYIIKYVPDDCEDKQYLLQDIDTIYKYFCYAVDAEQYPTVKEHFKDLEYVPYKPNRHRHHSNSEDAI